jgi:hypothetical protein
LVLSQLASTEPFTSSTESDSEPEIATNVRAVRRLVKRIYYEPQKVSSNVETLIKSIDTLVLQNELLRHENSQLNSALITEKKHQKKGKPLGLLGDDDPKFGQFWSPYKVALRREEIKTRQEQEELEEKQQLEEKEQQEADNRQIQDQLHRERVEFNKRERIRKKAEKEAEQQRKRHERELKKAMITTKKKPKPVNSTL